MPVLISNLQGRTANIVKVNTLLLKSQADAILDVLGLKEWNVGIALMSNREIYELNKTHRFKNKPTDVLSFPKFNLKPVGHKPYINFAPKEGKFLGDLCFGMPYIKNQCVVNKINLDKRMETLLIHGICHLLNYDHEKDDDYIIMKVEEDRLFKAINANANNKDNNIHIM